jgi:hypothetical protein
MVPGSWFPVELMRTVSESVPGRNDLENLPEWSDKPLVPRAVHNGKNHLPAASLEVHFERAMEQFGDFTAVVAEYSPAPCSRNNGVVAMLQSNRQNL